jgi:hypothetical protein
MIADVLLLIFSGSDIDNRQRLLIVGKWSLSVSELIVPESK